MVEHDGAPVFSFVADRGLSLRLLPRVIVADVVNLQAITGFDTQASSPRRDRLRWPRSDAEHILQFLHRPSWSDAARSVAVRDGLDAETVRDLQGASSCSTGFATTFPNSLPRSLRP